MKLQSKEDFRALMFQILDPLKPHYSKGCARLRLGDTGATYAEAAIELEAFSRPLWALAPYWAGGGEPGEFAEIYRKGLAHGADPACPEYWGGFADYDQRFVEMAAIACAILHAPEVAWDPLTRQEKENLARWLEGINHYFIPECNWQFFLVLVNLALKAKGMPYDAKKTEESLARLESYYLGEGWYQDGAAPQKDYYISFAIHYYGLVYARLMEEEDPRRSQLFKERAAVFAKQFVYWFDANGAALPFGRSLTYRFAQVSFFSACLWAGVEPFPMEVMKGLIARHLEYWMGQKMFDRDGILTIGYGYPNLIMAERYNAPGSPYWAMKTFLLLGLPADHPFWAAEAAPLPALDPLKALPYADMLVQRGAKGEVTAYVPGVCQLYGHGHLPEKYSKFAYSTRFGCSMARSQFVLTENCPDSMLAFIIDDYVFVRKACESRKINEDSIEAVWRPFPGITVKTTLLPCEEGHVRLHEIDSEIECRAVDYGFAVQKFTEGYAELAGEEFARVQNAALACEVSGEGPDARPQVLEADPNTNLLWPNSAIPGVGYTIHKGHTTLRTVVKATVRG